MNSCVPTVNHSDWENPNRNHNLSPAYQLGKRYQKVISAVMILIESKNGERERERPGVLEFGGGLLLDAEDDGVGATDTYGGVALAHGFQGVFDLKQMAIW